MNFFSHFLQRTGSSIVNHCYIQKRLLRSFENCLDTNYFFITYWVLLSSLLLLFTKKLMLNAMKSRVCWNQALEEDHQLDHWKTIPKQKLKSASYLTVNFAVWNLNIMLRQEIMKNISIHNWDYFPARTVKRNSRWTITQKGMKKKHAKWDKDLEKILKSSCMKLIR